MFNRFEENCPLWFSHKDNVYSNLTLKMYRYLVRVYRSALLQIFIVKFIFPVWSAWACFEDMQSVHLK